MSEIVDFGFEESKVIKPAGIERFKLGKPGEIARISIVSFKKYSDTKIAQKAREKGAPLTDDEISDIISKKFGDAEQTIATIVMVYPTNRDGTIDMDYLKAKKNIDFQTLKMTAKKFKKIESTYADSRASEESVIDLKVTLDGEPKYQKFLIESGRVAAWARKDADEELRNWVIEQGIRCHKYTKNELGFEMSREKLVEKLNAAGSQSTPETNSDKPKIQGSYNKLLED